MNYTYLLCCSDGTFYCGWTNHLSERVKAHNEGRGAKYTKARRPVSLVYYETYATKQEAMRREAAIKRMSRKEKERLVKRENEMRIIVSPAKRMRVLEDELPWSTFPVFLERSNELLSIVQRFSEAELKTLFKANDAITHENYLRYQGMDLKKNLTPAALAYVGIQYQYIAPRVFTLRQWEYICRRLRILSGLYGVLRACDGVVPYRLEMQARLSGDSFTDLYDFWKDDIYREIAGVLENSLLERGAEEERTGARILNLASKEYSRAVEPWLRPEDQFVTCVFGTLQDGRVKVKATEAKMARGEMVRFLAEREAEGFDEVKRFERLGFRFHPERSTEQEYIFLKEEKSASAERPD